MAYLDLTQLNAEQFKNVQNDIQPQQYGNIRALEASDASSPVLGADGSPIRQHLSQVEDQAFEVPALKEDVLTTTTAESLTIPANLGESDTITATKITHFTGFHYFARAHQNAFVDGESYLTHKMTEVDKSMATAKEIAIEAALDGEKTQALAGADNLQVPGFNFNGTTDILEIDQSGQTGNFFGLMKQLGMRNFMGQDLIMTASALGLTNVLNAWFKNGGDQAINLQNSFNSSIPFFETLNAGALDANTVGKGHVFKRGALGTVNNFTYDFRNNTETGDGYSWGISQNALPNLGAKVGLIQRSVAEDGTNIPVGSRGTIAATGRLEFGFVHQYFLVTTFKTDITTRPSDSVKFNLLDS